jgi:glycosyltransferase involved in cell wall biosynthesis
MTTHRPLSVIYLLEDTALFGGVKVILNQANLLAARGHQISVVSRGPAPTWMDIAAEFRQVANFDRQEMVPADVTVATFWTTIAPAMEIARGEVAHYCQGFEATYTHNTADHPTIIEAYRNQVPALVVSPHLGHLLARDFDRPSRLVLQPLEPFWNAAPPSKMHPSDIPRVLVVGPWEGDWKGVSTALDAVDHMRRTGRDLCLVRLSQYPLTDEERSRLVADEYHHHLTPEEAASLVAGCDVLLAPSWEQEGFGLPVLEAFASGVPVVASDISCFRSYASEAAFLAPAREPEAFARMATRVLEDPALWRRHRRSGLTVANRYSPREAAESAEEALRWVATGEWRRE